MLLAQRLRGRQPVAVARRQRTDHRGDGVALFFAAYRDFDQRHDCSSLFLPLYSNRGGGGRGGQAKPRTVSRAAQGRRLIALISERSARKISSE